MFEGNVVDCGLHALARFKTRTDDVEVAALARDAGIIVEPLSSYYVRPGNASGLLLGFSGYQPDDLREAARRLAAVLADRLHYRERAAAV
jgi:GntR family transcriptional regulator/MocR family aminotransferase